jgi:peptidoglycan/LPS O-acetylase OafA/YrhL
MTDRSTGRSDITGLRGVAVAAVIAVHAWGWPTGGYLGVDMFFVISGFVITQSLLREKAATGRYDVPAFAIRRFKRLGPSAGVVLIAVAVTAGLLFTTGRASEIRLDAVAGALGVANWRFALQGTDYFAADLPPSPLEHFWSLSVEEQFYLLWPLLLAVLTGRTGQPRRRAVWLALGLTAASLISTALLDGPSSSYFSTSARIWEVGTGCFLAAITIHRPPVRRRASIMLGAAGWAAVLLSLLAGDPRFGAPLPVAAPTVAGVAMILVAGTNPEPTWHIAPLRSRLLCCLGEVSYPAYLWHQPLLVIAPLIAPVPVVIVVVLSLGLAVGTAFTVERPLRNAPVLRPTSAPQSRHRAEWRHWWLQHRRSMRIGALVTLCTVTTSTTVVAVAQEHAEAVRIATGPAHESPMPGADVGRSGDPQDEKAAHTPAMIRNRSRQVQAALSATRWPRTSPSIDDVSAQGYIDSLATDPRWTDVLGCSIAGSQRSAAACTFGPEDGRLAVVVGDSTAAFMMPALKAIAEADDSNWRVLDRARFACPFTSLDVTFAPDPGCAAHRQQVVDEIARLEPDLVIVMNTSSEVDGADGAALSDNAWANGVGEIVRRFADRAAETVILTPNPPGPDVRECGGPTSRPTDCVTGPAVGRVRAYRALADVRTVDTAPLWCSGSRCPAFVDGELVRLDKVHMTPEASRAVAPSLAALLASEGLLRSPGLQDDPAE